ncbi:MAG TPA: transketolase [Bacilli bacterium]|nr:transketolase [Bacilli bacterium]
MANIIDKMSINAIKALSIGQIDSAKSGHPGIALGASTILYTLYNKQIVVNPDDDRWFNRDRFVLSCGHGSALLYSILYFAGFNINISDLKSFRKLNSITPGHPEYGITPGVDATTGPLGQGFGMAVGMAIAESYLRNKFNIYNYYTYVLASDGDLMEGITSEAASLAGTLKLGKLIVLYDSNNISLDGSTKKSFTENVCEKFKAFGWDVKKVKNDVSSINKAIERAKEINDKPSLIEVKTIIGEGSILKGSNLVHGSPLEKEDIKQLYKKLKCSDPFEINEKLLKSFKDKIIKRYKQRENENKHSYKLLSNKENIAVKNIISNKQSYDVFNIFEILENDDKETRNINSNVLNVLANKYDDIIGGSADLFSSTKVYIKNGKDFSNNNCGKNIWYGVREQAMGAITNGLVLSGLRGYCSTFLAFSDYVKPAIRMSAIMNIPATYIFTHDSISVGEDGPTHEPIEQLGTLRSIPNLYTFRPADYNEIIGMWNCILNNKKPSVVVLSRNDGESIPSDRYSVSRGAYIVKHEKEKCDIVLIASGSEVKTVLNIVNKLYENGIDARVVSMPCMKLFDMQSDSYKNEILNDISKRIFIEKSNDYNLRKYVDSDEKLININRFGISASKEDILKEFGFDEGSIYNKIVSIIKN